MNKRFVIIAGLVLLTGAAGIGLLGWYANQYDSADVTERDVREAALKLHGPVRQQTSALTPLEPNKPVRLAIGGLGLPSDELNRKLSDLVTADLTGAQGLELVERQSLDKVLDEIQLSFSGLVRAKDAVRVGKILRADWFLLGTKAAIGGTNSIVLRLVDGRTGILREVGLVSADDDLISRTATKIATFVRKTREAAVSPKIRTYLAIGTFEDLSSNNRLAEFPTQLRGYLMSAYRNGEVRLLEREYVETLLREVQLDLAGLSEESNATSQSMQSAFWFVAGCYQAYGTNGQGVEMNLEVRRIFGTGKATLLRGDTQDAMNAQIKEKIDTAMEQNPGAITPSRVSEARAQMAKGKEVCNLDSLIMPSDEQVLDEQEVARRRHNAQEAVRAFETVLLLEPTNRQAKMYLAACLTTRAMNRMDKARDYYREILEEPVQDMWVDTAQRALHFSFPWRSPEAKLQWFEAAAAQTTNKPAAVFYRQEVESARAELVLKAGGAKAQALAEQGLFATLTNAFFGAVRSTGIRDFVKVFGTNEAAAAVRLADAYPKLREQAPNLAPYFLASIVTSQVDTNASVVSEFGKMLEHYTGRSGELVDPDNFWSLFSREIMDWSFAHNDYALAAKFMEDKLSSGTSSPLEAWRVTEDKMHLAFAYLGMQQWAKALPIFESYSNRPVRMVSWGPWGHSQCIVQTSKEVELCRQKLGLSSPRDHLEFDMGKPVLHLHAPSIFVADESGLWVGIGGRMFRLDFEMRTNKVVELPMEPAIPITAISRHGSSLWIGTAGAGLIEFNTESQKCQHYGVGDGLMMSIVSCVVPAGDGLWIGYGSKTGGENMEDPGGGGLGRLDLTSRKFSSFVPSIAAGTDAQKARRGNLVREALDQPTLRAIQALATGPKGDVWFGTDWHALRHYRTSENIWEGSISSGNCTWLAAEGDRLMAGWLWDFDGDKPGPLGVSTFNFREGSWQSCPAISGLPAGLVTTLTPDHGDLWVGGAGYIALLDSTYRLRRYAYVQASGVEQIQIGGGYVWAKFDGHLYRAGLSQAN